MDIQSNPQLFEEKANMLKALAHPVRLCIVNGLVERKSSNVKSMQNCLLVPQSTVSQHLSILKSAGIIKSTRHGLEIYYELVDADTVKGLIELLFSNEFNLK